MLLKMCSEPDSCVWLPINAVKDIMFIKAFCLKNTSYNTNDRGRHTANSVKKSISECTKSQKCQGKKRYFESADRDHKVIFARTRPEVLDLKGKC